MKITNLPLLAVVLTVLFVAVQVESNTLGEYVREVKQYLVDKAKDKIISRSTMLTSFQDAMNIVQQRFEQAKKEGKLEGKDEAEAQVIYFGIVTEEIHNLRKRVESDKSGELGKVIGQSAKVVSPAELKQLSNAHKTKLPEGADPEILDMDMDLEDNDEDDWVLLNEMDSIEQDWLNEAEYGDGLDEHSLQALRVRTAHFMQDLMNNEIRQLATAVVGAYLTGGSACPLAVMAIINSSKYKFFEFFVNCVMDVLTAITGKKIQLVPVEQLSARTTESSVEFGGEA